MISIIKIMQVFTQGYSAHLQARANAVAEWIKPSDSTLGDQGFKSQVEVNYSLRIITVYVRKKYPLCLFRQRCGLMDNPFGLNVGRSGVQIPGRGKCLPRTITVYARVNYPLYLYARTNAVSK